MELARCPQRSLDLKTVAGDLEVMQTIIWSFPSGNRLRVFIQQPIEDEEFSDQANYLVSRKGTGLIA